METMNSNFESHLFKGDICDVIYNYRILKMKNSLFIYIGQVNNEIFDEMAMAMPMQDGEITSTTIMGAVIGYGSKELAEKISRKLKKQIYLSCNVPEDRIIRPSVEKRLIDEINNNKEYF